MTITTMPSPQFFYDRMRAKVRRSIRRQAYGLDPRTFALSLVEQSTGHLAFHLAYGQWISSRCYSVEWDDDDGETDDVIDRALTDLRADMTRHPLSPPGCGDKEESAT